MIKRRRYSRLTFGKHRGLPLDEVPVGYLGWVLRECECVDPAIRQEIQQVLRDALDGADENANKARGLIGVDKFVALLSRWRKEMALRFHPDRGGSHETMQALNVAYDRLRELMTAH